MSHVTNERVTSSINAPRNIWMSHVIYQRVYDKRGLCGHTKEGHIKRTCEIVLQISYEWVNITRAWFTYMNESISHMKERISHRNERAVHPYETVSTISLMSWDCLWTLSSWECLENWILVGGLCGNRLWCILFEIYSTLQWWCSDDAVTMQWWCSDDAVMMQWWCSDDAVMMQW